MQRTKCTESKFTRAEFYELVWSKPATHLAKELGCSDSEIGILCKSHDIPKPFAGYWMMLVHGKAPERPPLPISDGEASRMITVINRAAEACSDEEPKREPQYDDEILQKLDLVAQLGPLRVGKALRSPHSLVSKTQAQIAENTTDCKKRRLPEKDYGRYSRSRDMLAVEVSPGMTGRALRIMDAFIKRIVQLGGKVEIRRCGYDRRERATTVVIAGVDVTTLRLREKRKKVPSTKKDEFWDRWGGNRIELVPTGILLFDLGPGSFGRELLIDETNRKLEDGLNDLIIRLIKKAGEIRIQKRVDAERTARLERQQEIDRERKKLIKKRKKELRQQKKKEQERIDALVSDATCFKMARAIRTYLHALSCSLATEEGTIAIDGDTAQYLRWAHQQADRLDPLCESPHSVLDEDLNTSGIGPNRPR
ncbi:hypothetical protein TBK1r_64300 [Stieleria magnilauensis]|uniref:Uncharacterized protein n=2 Tax=Stieleria magnilauensis TaxID=2527963 RepID=A0ABX5Y2I0_9BACT|nr:hypothetical protein TBK1r_64300 [Planctomycetes bacterium TBK1r]